MYVKQWCTCYNTSNAWIITVSCEPCIVYRIESRGTQMFPTLTDICRSFVKGRDLYGIISTVFQFVLILDRTPTVYSVLCLSQNHPVFDEGRHIICKICCRVYFLLDWICVSSHPTSTKAAVCDTIRLHTPSP